MAEVRCFCAAHVIVTLLLFIRGIREIRGQSQAFLLRTTKRPGNFVD
jgi:hypothetical protein